MDAGRLRDIARLNQVIKDTNRTKGRRREADRTKKLIVKQLRDRKLRRLREQLIKASAKHDLKTELKLVNTIKNYLKQEQIEV
jgi:hypothetical protein